MKKTTMGDYSKPTAHTLVGLRLRRSISLPELGDDCCVVWPYTTTKSEAKEQAINQFQLFGRVRRMKESVLAIVQAPERSCHVAASR